MIDYIVNEKNLDKYSTNCILLRQLVKNSIKYTKKLTSLKYLSEYELAINKTYNGLFIIKTLIQEEIVKVYIDN